MHGVDVCKTLRYTYFHKTLPIERRCLKACQLRSAGELAPLFCTRAEGRLQTAAERTSSVVNNRACAYAAL